MGDKMKDFWKNLKLVIRKNYIIIFILSLVLGMELYELDYSVYSPGGLINVDERLSNHPYTSEGSFNMTYVTYRKGSIMNLIIAKFLPTFDIIDNEDITLSNEDINDVMIRDEIQIRSAISNATYMAYNKAGKKIEEVNGYNYVYYITPEANTNLKVGDMVIACDGNEVKEMQEINECVTKHDAYDKVELKVVRNNKEITTTSYINQEKLIGIIIQRVIEYDIDPKITYRRDKNESGSSGGLMLSLSLYNALVEEDITKGKKIAGTGTIEMDGSVGEISGVKYKIKGAVKNKVDLFIVPEANYEEAVQVIEENNFDLKLLKASTFDQVLDDLKSLN